MTLRLDALNSMAKQLGSRLHEKALGLSLRDVRLLLLVHEQPGLTVGELVEMSFLERTLVSKSVTQLSRMKLVKRCAVVEDARQVGLRLTATGEETARRAREIALNGINGMMSVLTPHEREIFEIALEKMTLKVSTDLEAVLRAERDAVPAKPQAAAE
ncbi:MarR family winged helix-turn-helix transcriptional regulator [Methylobacterium sp. JK268]